jgi:hypothetical protein
MARLGAWLKPGSFLHIPVVEYILSPNPGGGALAPDIALAKLEVPVTHIDSIPVRYQDVVDGSDLGLLLLA